MKRTRRHCSGSSVGHATPPTARVSRRMGGRRARGTAAVDLLRHLLLQMRIRLEIPTGIAFSLAARLGRSQHSADR